MSDNASLLFVPFAVETYGYIGKEAFRFVNCLGDITAESGRIPKGAFVRWAMQPLSATVQRGNAEMHRRSGLIMSRDQGFELRCWLCSASANVMMGHVYDTVLMAVLVVQ